MKFHLDLSPIPYYAYVFFIYRMYQTNPELALWHECILVGFSPPLICLALQITVVIINKEVSEWLMKKSLAVATSGGGNERNKHFSVIIFLAL